MAISIDYLTKIIFVPRADLVLLQSSPSFIYQMNLEWFYRQITDIQDDQAGIPYVTAANNTAPVTVGGVTLARVVEIINGYTVEFEDGQYAVNLTGANTNVQDVAIVNQVSIRPNNSAGLQDLSVLLQAAYGGVVNVDVVNGQAGTVIPLGTRGTPVNNFADALTIAMENSLPGINLMKSATLSAGDFASGFVFSGDSQATVTMTIDPGANVENCTFENMTIQGTMDGDNTFRQCHLLDISYTNGFIVECALDGIITIGGGAQCSILDSWSNVAGRGPGQYPSVDMGGFGNSLALRNYAGGLGLRNYSGGGDVSMDFNSGRAVIESTVTAGDVTVAGVADVDDQSTGTANVIDSTVNESLSVVVTIVSAINTAVLFIRKLMVNKSETDGSLTTTYDDDKTTPLQQWSHTSVQDRDPL